MKLVSLITDAWDRELLLIRDLESAHRVQVVVRLRHACYLVLQNWKGLANFGEADWRCQYFIAQ